MDNLPKSAITVARAVVEGEACQETIGKLMEVACNRAQTRFWLWSGHYYQMSNGPVRAVKHCREITREEAIAKADEFNALDV